MDLRRDLTRMSFTTRTLVEEVERPDPMDPEGGVMVEERSLVVATTSQVDRYGDIVDQASLLLDPYRANPVLLYAHNASGVVVGNADPDSIEVREGLGLVFAPVWDDAEVNPQGRLVAHQWGTFLRTVSIGFIPGSVVPRASLPEEHPYAGDSGLVFYQNEVLEISVTPVPANPGAKKLSADAPTLQDLAATLRALPPADLDEALGDLLGQAVSRALCGQDMVARVRGSVLAWLRDDAEVRAAVAALGFTASPPREDGLADLLALRD